MSETKYVFPPTKDEFPHPFVFQFERSVDATAWNVWFQDHWTNTFIYSLIYCIVIFGGKYLMRNRERFELRPQLALWSLSLAVFSIIGSLRFVPELLEVVWRRGIQGSLCDRRFYTDTVTNFWSLLFVLSKAVELGDTVFIVLRKQKLIFLHWYHHITVLIFVWSSYQQHAPIGRWFACMNYVVHSFMYSYYALRASKVYLPRWVNMYITSLQIAQMAVGLLGCLVSAYIKYVGELECPNNNSVIFSGTLMYISYFVLFGNYFYHTYLKSSPPTPKPVAAENSSNGHANSHVHANGDSLRQRRVAA